MKDQPQHRTAENVLSKFEGHEGLSLNDGRVRLSRSQVIQAMEEYASQFRPDAPSAGMWVDIKQQQPKEYERVIGYFPNGIEGSGRKPTVDTAHWTGDKLVSDYPNSTSSFFEATKWMQFPIPAEQKK